LNVLILSEKGGHFIRNSRVQRIGGVVFVLVYFLFFISILGPARAEKIVNVGFVFGITEPYATYVVPMRDAMN